MKRGVFDVLRRGLDNALANWPLVLLRLGESVVFLLLAIAGFAAILFPILVSIGVDLAGLTDPDELRSAALALLGRWTLIVWIILGISVLLLVIVALHAFVEAGSARIYADGERNAGPALEGPRARFAVFSFERWFAGARQGWWTVFWIYNLAWALASAILLIPLVPTAALLLAMRDKAEPAAVIGVGCLGLGLTFMLLIVVGIGTSLWVSRSIAEWATRNLGARAALAVGSRAIRTDFGRHILTALMLIAVALGGSMFFSTFSMFAGIGRSADVSPLALMFAPVEIIATICNSAFSSAVTAWFAATYVSLSTE